MKLILKDSYDYVAILLLISLSFSKALPNILLGLLTIIFFLKIYRKKNIFYSEYFFATLGLLFFYLVLKAIIYQTFITDLQIFSRFALLFFVALFLLQVPRNKLIIGFVFSLIIAIVIASKNILSYYITYQKLPFESGDIVNEILVIERPYFGFFCLIGVILSLYLSTIYKKHKWFFYIFSIFTSIFIFFIAARLSLISLVLVFLIYIFFYSKLLLLQKISILICLVFVLGLTLISYKNLSNRFFTNTDKQKLQIYDPRVVIWGCAKDIASLEKFNSAFGSESYLWIEQQYKECYSYKNNDDLERKNYFINRGFNSHNQFLDLFLYGGYIGLILFILFVGNILYVTKHNFYFFSITLSLFLFFILENVLHRQFGCYLVAFVLALGSRRLKVQSDELS